jgi:hypothetical protein
VKDTAANRKFAKASELQQKKTYLMKEKKGVK